MSILIDDDDPLVLYNSPGGWAKHGKGSVEFDGTTHASGTHGDTATLAFEGTSISVYGTLAPSLGQSRMNFSVDGVEAGSYIGPQVPAASHNLLFWTSPVYPQGSHQLVVTIDQDVPLTAVNPLNRTFFLDYFVYTTTSAAGKTVLIDDNDRSVTYSDSDNWQSSDDSDDSDSCLERTKHTTKSAGSWVAVPFNGTQISLIGAPGQKGFKASVSIDGSPAGQISQPQNKNQLFNSAVLSPGPHTINVTFLGGNPMAVDYFLATSGSDALIPAANSSQAAGTPASGKRAVLWDSHYAESRLSSHRCYRRRSRRGPRFPAPATFRADDVETEDKTCEPTSLRIPSDVRLHA
ncbi:Right-handed parallel beta-helix repeat-containing protein [Mycena venus]|uniref:Right-handed parallel beta-helix repeat-containing protein n=1 Tax=Mycena venus TaxID=2733690 RepID=A0A8H6X5U5_9AGAR|nr:Right-handed parallel beta-helix repeat-containing protein [Mycena venus]